MTSSELLGTDAHAREAPIVVRLNARTYPVIPEEREILAPFKPTVRELEGAAQEEILSAVSGCNTVMVVSSTITARVIAAMPSCRVIARMGRGWTNRRAGGQLQAGIS